MKIEDTVFQTMTRLEGTSEPGGILSVYLPIEASTSPHKGYVSTLMDILRAVDEPAGAADKAAFEEASAKVLAYVREEFRPHGSAVIIFSGRPGGTWETLTLQDEVPALAVFGSRPYLLPLKVLAEDLPETIVALVSHEEARIFQLAFGELEAAAGMRSDVPGRQRQGGWAASRIERDRQHHIEEHFHRVAVKLEEMAGESACRYLVLAGTDDNRQGLEKALSEHLREMTIGHLDLEMFTSEAQVVDSARVVVEAAQRREEEHDVRAIIDAALSHGRGVVGFDQTVQRLRDGRVHKLLLSGRIVYTHAGAIVTTLADSGGAALEIVHGEAEELLRPYAGVAASLRY